MDHMLTRSCKICNKRTPRYKDNGKWTDGNGRWWNGKVCPDCANKIKANKQKKKREYNKKSYNVICKICGTKFIAYNSASKCCSKKCKVRHFYNIERINNNIKEGEWICITCKSPFKTDGHFKACEECRNKSKENLKQQVKIYNQKKRDSKPPKLCKTCNKILDNKQLKYCSDDCSPYKSTVYEVTCLCGKKFETTYSFKKYCSKQCVPRSDAKNEARRLRKRIKTQRKLSCVTWSEIKEIYKNKGDFQVDHIIPINNEFVSGLHVPWNFQYLSPEDNVKKSNSFDGTYDNDGWRN